LALTAPPESNRHLERTQHREVMVASFRPGGGIHIRSRGAAVRQLAKLTDRGGGTMRLRSNAHWGNGAIDPTDDLPTA